MDQEQPNAELPSPRAEAELMYCYFGFASSLRRYRRMTLLGWVVAAAGFLSLMIGWREGTPHGMLDMILSVLTATAGIGLVQQSVMALEAYIRPRGMLSAPVPGEERRPVIAELIALMEEVEAGGWQEAYAAVEKLRMVGSAHGLPAP